MGTKVVDVTITRRTASVSRAGFGTPLIAAYHTAWPDRVREYAEADDLLDDGFTTEDVAYKIASVIKSQSPSPTKFKVGRRASAFTQTVRLIPTVTTEGFVYSGTINGQTFSRANGGTETVATIVTALQALIDAFTGVSAADDTTHVTVTNDTAGEIAGFSVVHQLHVLDATTDPGIAADLAAISEEDDDWYGLCLDSNSEAEILAAAAWVETRRKIMSVQSPDWDTKDAGETTDVFSMLQTASYERTVPWFHAEIGDWLAAGILARMLTTTPGSATWAHKTVKGVKADKLLTGEETALEGKNANYYRELGGSNRTFEGKTPGGEFADVMRFIDWVHARVTERVFFVLFNNDKVPYTDAGAEGIRAAVQAVMLKGVENGGFTNDPAPVVTVPKVADVDPSLRADRILPDVKFSAVLAGAIHTVKIAGTVAV